jgi:hypothetical protein
MSKGSTRLLATTMGMLLVLGSWAGGAPEAQAARCNAASGVVTLRVGEYFDANLSALGQPVRNNLINVSTTYFNEIAQDINDNRDTIENVRSRGGATYANRLEGINITPPNATRISSALFLPILSEICPSAFGDFTFSLPGLPNSIDELVQGGRPIISYMNAIMSLMLGFIIALALISVAVGGYIYMTAGGGDRLNLAKNIIVTALTGLVLALTAYLLLNTLGPQFTNVEEPAAPPAAPAP